jgi:hypothetical protein
MADDGIRVCCDHRLPAIFLVFCDRRGEAVRAHGPIASPRSGGTASASNEDTASVPAGVQIGGPFQLIDATAAMMQDMTGIMWGTGLVWLIVIVVPVLPSRRSRSTSSSGSVEHVVVLVFKNRPIVIDSP